MVRSFAAACKKAPLTFLLVVELASVAILVGGTPVVLMAVFKRFMLDNGVDTEASLALYNVNFMEREYLILPNNTNHGRMILLLRDLPTSHFVFYSFPFFIFASYLTPRGFPVTSATTLFLASIGLFIYLFQVKDATNLFVLMPLLMWLLAGFLLRFYQSEGSKLAKQMFQCVLLLFIGHAIVLLHHFYDLKNDTYVAIIFGIYYPFLREVMRFIGTRSAWYLTFSSDVVGPEQPKPYRFAAWVMFGWVQMTWAMWYRFQVINLANPYHAILVPIWQALLEVVLRLTHYQRDIFFHGMGNALVALFRIRPRRVNPDDSVSTGRLSRETTTSVIKLSRSESMRMSKCKINSLVSLDETRKFYSMVVMVEMMTEYSGIITSLFFVWYWSDKVIFAPFLWYTQQPLDEVQQMGTLYTYTGMQVILELLVDTLCTALDSHRSVGMLWQYVKKNHKYSFCNKYALTALLCSNFGIIGVNLADNIFGCIGRPMCECSGGFEGSLRNIYCNFFNTTNATLAPGSY